MDEDDYYDYNVTRVLAGIVFDENFDYGENDQVPDLNYKIRMKNVQEMTNILYPLIPLSGPGNHEYKYTKFTWIQTLIDFSYIEILTGEKLLPKNEEDFEDLRYVSFENSTLKSIEISQFFYLQWPVSQRMAYPPYEDTKVQFFVGFMGFFAVLSFTFIIPPIMKRIVQEKKTGAKELMKMMGLPNWMSWLFHFLDAITTTMISLIIIIVLISVEWISDQGKVLDYSNPFLVYILFLFYSMALIMFLFMISTLFTNRKFFLLEI